MVNDSGSSNSGLKNWIAGNKGFAATAAAAVVLLLLLVAVFWWSIERIRSERHMALAEHARADESAALAHTRKTEFDLLASVPILEEALAKELELYPAWPERILAMERWLAEDAARLLAINPILAKTLTEMEGRALPWTPEERTRDKNTHPRYAELRPLAIQVASRRRGLGDSEEVEAAEETDDRQPTLPELESELASLQKEVSRRRSWRFASQPQQFLHSTMSNLSGKIKAFEEDVIRNVEARLGWARRIENLTLNHPSARTTWEEANKAILAADGVVASKLYREHPISLKPQLGLVPIGMNPVTQLWEFYHLRTAYNYGTGNDPSDIVIPQHAEDGSLSIRENTGLVFILIPGGTFWMGAQRVDPSDWNYDPQVTIHEFHDGGPVEVTLEPYFLSRFELTQGQCERTMGLNPSIYHPGTHLVAYATTLVHPVEHVSWDDSVEMLRRMFLRLPTEAQWEFACRAGTGTPWWTGKKKEELDEAGNLADQHCKEFGGPRAWKYEDDLNDGQVVHAPVGQFRANAFGLHDVIGNVWEWCLDDFATYGVVTKAGNGRREVSDAPGRVVRGGSFADVASYARSASRDWSLRNHRNRNLGVRPARAIQR